VQSYLYSIVLYEHQTGLEALHVCTGQRQWSNEKETKILDIYQLNSTVSPYFRTIADDRFRSTTMQLSVCWRNWVSRL